MAHLLRRPTALPAALGLCLIASGGLRAAGSIQPQTDPTQQEELLADLEAFEAERSAFRRLLPGERGMTAESVAAYYEALFLASQSWVRRWPRREFAWRARLEALLGLVVLTPEAAREAALGAVETLRHPGNIVYPEPTELLAARALVRHHADLPLARELARRALAKKLEFLDRLEAARPGQSFDERRRRWRWRTALVRVEAAEAEGDAKAWQTALEELEGAVARKPCSPEPPPSDRGSCGAASPEDARQTAIEYAVGQLELHRQRARFARALGNEAAALGELLRAVELRPAFGSKVEPPANQAAIDEARAGWLADGRSQQDWDAWIERRKGYPIPRAMR